tara:strand:+ start:860 stop:1657 length:798 start_codon:yes stop_codon:yes gene_type:complete
MYTHKFDPILISFGFIEIRWYSLAYIFGILLGWWLGKKIIDFRLKSKLTTCKIEDFDELITYLIISIILGGRLGYVIFYNFDYYMNNPMDILKIWEGGMSFHGGLIGIIIATYLFAKNNNIKIFNLLDIVACVAPIGLFFGRVANFINGELYGNPSNMPWSVVFPNVDNLPRHPSQLYEAFLEGIVLFILLNLFIFNKKAISGLCSSLFLIFYGLFRIIGEQFREPDLHIGYLFNLFSLGSVLSFVMIVVGAFILLSLKKNEQNS